MASSSSKRVYEGYSGFATWYGGESWYQIDTGLDAGFENSGYWFDYADGNDGGASSIAWPVEPGNGYEGGEDALDPIIDYCGGVCGTFHLNKGFLDKDPFVVVGFNIAGEDDSRSAIAADASAMGGVCIAYSSDVPATLEMGLGDVVDATLDNENPSVSLPKSVTGRVMEFSWHEFVQRDGLITGPEAAKQLVALRFKVQGKDGTTGKFNIMSVGALGGGCAVTVGAGDL